MIVIAVCLSIAPVVVAQVRPSVFLNDGETPVPPIDPNYPHIYPDIMVGTKLTIIVDSNVAEYWSGSLAIEDANMDYGVLSCRECNDIFIDCDGSLLPAAGDGAEIWLWDYFGVHGYDLYTHSRSVMSGDWFIIDYVATNVGICHVGFYDHSVDRFKPIHYLTFSHVPTRDFTGDTVVDFGDFALLASYWQATTCGDPDWCEGTDLDWDQDVDFGDVSLFADYWLEKTEQSDVTHCNMPLAGAE